jgi:uncharacterized protein (DUF1778 family)
MSEENDIVEETLEEKVAEPDLADLGLTGKEVEDFMIKAGNERAQDPTEMAAAAYAMYGPYFKLALPKLSTRSLRRILNYLVFYPLEQDSVKAANEAEKSVMQLANFLIEAKFVMVLDSHRLSLEKVYAASQDESLTAEQEAEVIETLKAGGVSDEEIERLKNKNQENNNG